MNCNCIEEANQALEGRGECIALRKGFAQLQIGTRITWVPKIETKRIGSNASGSPLIANFCPLCGTKIDT